MMKRKTTKKLSFDTSTVRNLTQEQLREAAGGISSAKVWCSTWEDTGCCNYQDTDACTSQCHY